MIELTPCGFGVAIGAILILHLATISQVSGISRPLSQYQEFPQMTGSMANELISAATVRNAVL